MTRRTPRALTPAPGGGLPVCVVCGHPTASTVSGRHGDRIGRICQACRYWADGNVTA